MVREVVLRQPDETAVVDDLVGQRGRHRALGKQPAEGLTLVESEGGDIDETDHVCSVRTERGHDLAAVGVAGDDRGTVLQGQDLTEPSEVVGQRGERELRCGHL